MQFLFVAQNAFWWNYHIGLAIHDERIQSLDPKWQETVFEDSNMNKYEWTKFYRSQDE